MGRLQRDVGRHAGLLAAVGTAVGSLCQLAWLLHFLRGGRLDTAPFPYARDGEAYLGCVLGKVCYSWGAAAFTGLYLVATRNKVCPLGCAVCPRWRRGRRAHERVTKLAVLTTAPCQHLAGRRPRRRVCAAR